MSMSAQQIFDATRDVPEEARPKGLVLLGGGARVGRGVLTQACWYFDLDTEDPIQLDNYLAELAFVGSMVAWLIKQLAGNRLELWHCGDHFHTGGHEGNDLLVSLAQACRAVGERS